MNETTLHPGQSEVYRAMFVDRVARYGVVAACRGWGKSMLLSAASATAVAELLLLDTSVPNKNVYVIAPTHSQSRSIYYSHLAYGMGLAHYCIRPPSKDTGEFLFPRGVTLQLVSYEAIDRLRGTGAYFVGCDEVRDWTSGEGFKGAWEGVLEPCITTRWNRENAELYGAVSPGRGLVISTTRGFDYFYDMHNMPLVDDEYRSWSFDHTQAPYVSPREIERVRSRIDALTFNREYMAKFQASGASVFYAFERDKHTRKDIPELGPTEDILVAIDFNVNKQCTSIWVRRDSILYCIDEMEGHPDTEQLAVAIAAKYWPGGDRVRRIRVYPDPTGRSRKTSAPVGRTDFSILEKAGFSVLARSSSPSIVDSVNAVNSRLCTANGTVHMYIHPRCKGVLDSLERTVWVENNPNTATICKKAGVEHYSDGIRYMIEYLYPITTGTKPVSRGFTF